MIAHLQQAIDRYPEEAREFHIHPISKHDAEIVSEVIELFRKMGFTAVVDVLKRYKKLADEDILEALVDLNTKIGRKKGEQEQADTEDALFLRYIKTCGRRIDCFLIIHHDCIEVEDQTGSLLPAIMLNRTPKDSKQIPMYSNEILVFNSEKERDEVSVKLDTYYELYRGKFF